MSAKEPCISAKEPCMSATEPCISTKEPCTSTKELFMTTPSLSWVRDVLQVKKKTCMLQQIQIDPGFSTENSAALCAQVWLLCWIQRFSIWTCCSIQVYQRKISVSSTKPLLVRIERRNVGLTERLGLSFLCTMQKNHI